MAYELLMTMADPSESSSAPEVIIEGRRFVYPVTDFNLLSEIPLERLRNSVSLAEALDSGEVTVRWQNDLPVTAADFANKFQYQIPGSLNNPEATTGPTADNDSTEGYGPLSVWLNEAPQSSSAGPSAAADPEAFVCLDATPGAAIWRSLTKAAEGTGLIQQVDFVDDATEYDVSGSQSYTEVYEYELDAGPGQYIVWWYYEMSANANKGAGGIIKFDGTQVGGHSMEAPEDDTLTGFSGLFDIDITDDDPHTISIELKAIGSGAAEIMNNSRLEILGVA